VFTIGATLLIFFLENNFIDFFGEPFLLIFFWGTISLLIVLSTYGTFT